MNGFILYRGPSMLDGAPIVCIVTGVKRGSGNSKTGGIVQTWVLREDVSPLDAANSGADASVCGGCPHRGRVVDGKDVGRSCYVVLYQAPLSVWSSYHRGIYPHLPPDEAAAALAGRVVRLGAYGDPAAVPFGIWHVALAGAAANTGYTHQWRTCDQRFMALCMASCDSPADFAEAKALGWRTFRVRPPEEPALSREVVCPASEEAGAKTDCASCRACGGLWSRAKADIVIAAHGAAAKVNGYSAYRAAA